MEATETLIENYGILASMSWNSNKWAGDPSKEDLGRSKYTYVQNKLHTHESLNFGHEIYPSEEDGYYIGYTPMLRKPPAFDKSSSVKIIFLSSSDYKNSNRKLIIGFYGNPEFGQEFPRLSKHRLFRKYDGGNIKALPEDIIYFDKPLVISNESVAKEGLLPEGKLISQRGFNYLNSDNVYTILLQAQSLNQQNHKLNAYVKNYPIRVAETKEQATSEDYYNAISDADADTLKGILELEKKMAKQTPEVRQRIASFIERGAISSKVKKLTGYKCLICDSLKENPYSFKKPNGDFYIETHHVEQVSTLNKGVLGINNLITVCANHHRQLHYGDSLLVERTATSFKFKIDGKTIKIDAIKIP
ncbi:hypothetical protein TH61_16335 [Rufibacter sp. DG15C]|uniref:HNH endonuclease n=1 Tax=Rufibacter sp. DG15C TaxID=1379909 RepID=UPI00078BC8BC|nr:HNH endonuclease [Rufibacter sp. DG15C]AMM52443.1 hypothetical protein TH61_16335 [Rufibacter sp. DG15C]